MRKRYLVTTEEILALKDTDTKIYTFSNEKYYKFVEGVLCLFSGDDSIELFNTNLAIGTYERPYVIEEEPFKRVDENDIGRLCKFWDNDPSEGMIGVLDGISKSVDDDHPYCMDCPYGNWFKHCRLLSPSEVAKITGYKVEEA